ncbi:CYTH domain-containing protein [Cytobacillus praedii]|jgi:uncharacterized protein YjbK|uniref:CYTH domain-containing protein n=1 Tax=Cytobacillus praedii TaxID=1742358 RepID=UPI002E1E53F8|nr:CYTH domain-containing protein [Cytobacillus praedii]
MTKVLEQELKLLIDKSGYERILNSSEIIRGPIIQNNYYFDTYGRCLVKQGMTLRIRQENEKWLLCLKVKNKDSSQLNKFVSSIEIEKEISENSFIECKNQPSRILSLLPYEAEELLGSKINELEYLGFLRNERYSLISISLKEYLFDLDRSFFSIGLESFELEFEGIKTNKQTEDILNFLTDIGLEYKLNKKSKYKRFLDSLNF